MILPRTRAPGASAIVLALAGCEAPSPPVEARGDMSWAFPGTRPPARAVGGAAIVRVPGSQVQYRRSQLSNRFQAVDWYPDTHREPPEVVMRGRAPAVTACAYCHMPDGQGMPSNAPLSGLGAAYIEEQIRSMAAGERGEVGDGWKPSELMHEVARAVTREETVAAAAYYSRQRYRAQVRVVESDRVPATTPDRYVYRQLAGSAKLPLGYRIVEIPNDFDRFAVKDSRLAYTAYVPKGAVERGRALARGDGSRTPQCASCHGNGLRGGAAPPLAGRYPSYLLRQLLAFRSGVRGGDPAAGMNAVASQFTDAELVALASYAAALPSVAIAAPGLAQIGNQVTKPVAAGGTAVGRTHAAHARRSLSGETTTWISR